MTIIVPYRDREEHLKEFIPAMSGHDIYIIGQADDKPFNRGKLINVGFLEARPEIFIAHDVDMIGEDLAYLKRPGINQLCESSIQLVDYLGGATMFWAEMFPGYHNDFWHRAEDNELMFEIKRLKYRVDKFNFKFKQLPHERTGPEFIPELWAKAQLPRTVNMLETCKYEIVSREKKEGYTLIKVLL
jgi:N-terminal region of glycosyl transferase group 7